MVLAVILKWLLNLFYYGVIARLLSPFLRGQGSIVMLHHVRENSPARFSPNDHLSVSPRFLEKLFENASKSYDFVSLDEVVGRLSQKGNSATRPFISVTLDDGYIDNIENALPIFRKYGVPFTVFVAPALVEGEATLWWEDIEHCLARTDSFYLELNCLSKQFETATPSQKSNAYRWLTNFLFYDVTEEQQRNVVSELCNTVGFDPVAHVKKSIANWEQIRELSKEPLCTIGAHTLGHVMLSKLSDEDAMNEMLASKQIIETEIGKPVNHFAYPYGFEKAAGRREFEFAQECGFSTAVTTRHGVIYTDHKNHITALPRISLNGRFQSWRETSVLLSGMPTFLKNQGKRVNVS